MDDLSKEAKFSKDKLTVVEDSLKAVHKFVDETSGESKVSKGGVKRGEGGSEVYQYPEGNFGRGEFVEEKVTLIHELMA